MLNWTPRQLVFVRAILTFWVAMCVPPAFAATTYTLSPWQLVLSGKVQKTTYPTYAACDQALRALPAPPVGTKVTDRCQIKYTVTTIADPTPAPTPDPTPTPAPPPAAAGTYTDLTSAPLGAWVTTYSPGLKMAVKFDGTNAPGVKIHAGRILEVWPDTDTTTGHPKLRTTWAGVKPGDVIYLHGGTYTGPSARETNYGEATWTTDALLDTFVQGTADQPIALVAYPGEAVTFKSSQGHADFVFGDGNGHKARYITLAGLNIIGRDETVTAGGDTSTDSKPESGGEYIRVVGNRLEITNATANTMTGIVSIQGDGWQVLGNTFVDPANRVVINNNHGLYIQNGADDVEVAYNTFRNLHVGFVVQIHQDGNPMLYERINVHDNYFEAANYGDMRGVTTSNIQSASTVTFANNTFRHLGGGGWGCINVYSGQVTIKGNDCQDTQNGLNVNGDTPNSRKITMDSNRLCPVAGTNRINYENGASASQVTETNPIACN